MLPSRRKFRKCCRIDEKCCRVDDILFPLGKKGKVVEPTRNVGESTKFPELSNRREMLSSRRHFQISREKLKVVNVVESTTFSMFHRKRKDLSNRREMLSSRRNLRKCCRAGEKCCRVDDISIFHRKRKRVVDPTTFPEMLSNRREMLSSGRHGEWC